MGDTEHFLRWRGKEPNQILGSWKHLCILTLINYTWGFLKNKKTKWPGKAKEKEGQRAVGEGQWGRALGEASRGRALHTSQEDSADCHSCHWTIFPREHWVMQLPEVVRRGGKQRSEVRSQEKGTHLPTRLEKWGRGEKPETLPKST